MLTSIQQIKSEGGLPDSLTDDKLQPHLLKASIEMKKILTAAVYNATEELNQDDEQYISCQIAEANLTLYFAIPSLNMETQGNGIVRSKGWDQSRSDLLSQNEVTKLQEYYKGVAMDLLKPYIPTTVDTTKVEYDTYTLFPSTGTAGFTYTDLSTGYKYTWNGSGYDKLATDEVRGANWRLSAI